MPIKNKKSSLLRANLTHVDVLPPDLQGKIMTEMLILRHKHPTWSKLKITQAAGLKHKVKIELDDSAATS
jgi:hypothetical protein